jgi:hypothetical protein
MSWLQRHAWRVLLAMAGLIAVIGINPVRSGIAEDESVPLGLAGKTSAQLKAGDPHIYRLIDFQARSAGFALIALGILLSAVVIGGFRRERRWAWWSMWVLPAWAAAVSGLIILEGMEPDQPRPWPVYSGVVIAALSSVLLLVTAPRFFGPNQAR